MLPARRLASSLLTLALFSAPSLARAGDDGVRPLSVSVGQTRVVDVGIAQGLTCDDVAIIDVDLRAHDLTSNWLYVTGRHPGTTMCRVGNFGEFLSYVFRVTVVPSPQSQGGTKR